MTEGAIIMRAAERVCNVAMAITDHVWSGERLQGSKEKKGAADAVRAIRRPS
jgi:hypothetical protein